MDLTLSRIRDCIEALGLGQPAFAAAQVVGTNGKGSTATFLASIAQKHGLTVGLYTSPHFVSPRERILINGRPLSEPAWVSLANAVLAAQGESLTYFELLTAMAVLAFERAGAHLAVFEAGLGGRYDATTAVASDLALFTAMGLDHQTILGPTLSAVAKDKAQALRQGGLALTAAQHPEAMAELASGASEKNARLLPSAALLTIDPTTGRCRPGPKASSLVPGRDLAFAGVRLGLAGPFQVENAQLALAGWQVLAAQRGWPSRPSACLDGLAQAFIPGRLQFVPAAPGLYPNLLLDGAHNEHALAALARSLAEPSPLFAFPEPSEASVLHAAMPPQTLPSPTPPNEGVWGESFPPAGSRGLAALVRLLGPLIPSPSPPDLDVPLSGLDEGSPRDRAPGGVQGQSPWSFSPPTALIFTCLTDKDLAAMAPVVRCLTQGPILVPELAGHPRARPAEEVAAILGSRARPVANLAAALALTLAADKAANDAPGPVLVCGSLYLLAEFFTLFPACLRDPHALRLARP